MNPKEELIQAIERSPEDLVRALLDLLRVLQRQAAPSAVKQTQPLSDSALGSAPVEEPFNRLRREQGILVIETGNSSGFDVNAFIKNVREEQIQHHVEQVDS